MPREQYEMDVENLAGEPDPTWVEADHHDEGSYLGLHFDNLHDQNATESGDLYDLATGKPYNNSSTTSFEYFCADTTYEEGVEEEIVEAISHLEENDLVAQWIEHQLKQQKYSYHPSRAEEIA